MLLVNHNLVLNPMPKFSGTQKQQAIKTHKSHHSTKVTTSKSLQKSLINSIISYLVSHYHKYDICIGSQAQSLVVGVRSWVCHLLSSSLFYQFNIVDIDSLKNQLDKKCKSFFFSIQWVPLTMAIVEKARAKINSSNKKLDNSDVEKSKPKCGFINDDQNLKGVFNHQDGA